jgi:hypothetical protein
MYSSESFMKNLIAIFFLTTTLAFSQLVDPAQDYDGKDASVIHGSCLTMGPGTGSSVERQAFSREGLRRDAKQSLTSSGLVSSFGIGGLARLNYKQSKQSALQFSSGYIAMRNGAQSNLTGTGSFASVVPIFIGMKQNLASTSTRSLEWTQYAVFGAGPIMGIEYPGALSFWQSISKLGFRWGAGAYAGLGSELRFNQGFGAYAQLELTGFAFTAPLLDRQSYLGPSFSFGIMFFPS